MYLRNYLIMQTEEIRVYFKSKWENDEQNWTKWNVNNIICWIKYLIFGKRITLSNNVDLDKINHMKASQV